MGSILKHMVFRAGGIIVKGLRCFVCILPVLILCLRSHWPLNIFSPGATLEALSSIAMEAPDNP